ncbi:MAG: InlB B-repeat-containing protein [Lachnospiraceae bacterium]|nr:InlB B-repeat-containing protein [Lachnospiraceae bacterium]
MNISVKSLDRIIGVCIAVILIVVALELRNPGFQITFDSRGGTDVPVQSQMYGELLEEPEIPTREGYIFTGWYTDTSCYEAWDIDTDTVQSDMTLYAGWQKLQ